ncbi:MAG: hypothetical protein F6K32_18425, partial [Desertifilum sp. SIO1I2]|nr:hypothetical protein [Desertifilum sp. SIO1I2]
MSRLLTIAPVLIIHGAGSLVFLTPVVHGINFAATKLLEANGTPPEEHPFTNIDLTGRNGTAVLFAVVACVLAPLA